ncbi:hypothetical protein CALCODRAFT_360023 [Calocera cornea HHB12733]|uniref:Uncharacterized protein n=1 Tax=Calocera cornea HHB12733 TaxID=1353952 RepID=A0A165EMG0_9BASI|nr:hypothetical protein CALCODRAFT_360023 [Calocera cornea HHB12733]
MSPSSSAPAPPASRARCPPRTGRLTLPGLRLHSVRRRLCTPIPRRDIRRGRVGDAVDLDSLSRQSHAVRRELLRALLRRLRQSVHRRLRTARSQPRPRPRPRYGHGGEAEPARLDRRGAEVELLVRAAGCERALAVPVPLEVDEAREEEAAARHCGRGGRSALILGGRGRGRRSRGRTEDDCDGYGLVLDHPARHWCLRKSSLLFVRYTGDEHGPYRMQQSSRGDAPCLLTVFQVTPSSLWLLYHCLYSTAKR